MVEIILKKKQKINYCSLVKNTDIKQEQRYIY